MYKFILVVLLFMTACNQSNVKSESSAASSSSAVLTVEVKQAEPEKKKGKGKVFLYNLTAEQTAYRLVEGPDDDMKDEFNETWALVNPANETCEPEVDPCSCAGIHEAKVVFVFWPGEYLQIEWQGKKGAGGYYHNGKIADGPEGWQYVSEPLPFVEDHECEEIELEHDQFQRLLKMSMKCKWHTESGLCKGEDKVVIEFPSVEEVRNPQPENLPWNAEIQGKIYRFNDDTENAPASAVEAGEPEQIEVKEDVDK